MKLFTDISLNEKYALGAFEGCGDLCSRRFALGGGAAAFIVYLDSMCDRQTIEQSVMTKLLKAELSNEPFDEIMGGVLATADAREEGDLDRLIDAVLTGEAALFVDKSDRAVIISAKSAPNRGVATVENEAVVIGSKDAFNENLRFTTVLIRRRLRDRDLKVRQVKVGRRSKTDLALLYIEGICRPSLVAEAERRIGNIDVDAVLDAGQLAQMLEDGKASPFPQLLLTERPDRAAAAILEGRLAVAVDNSPEVIIAPATALSFFQSPEDYYQRWDIMSMTRLLRFSAAFIAVSLPALYVAAVVYHPDMLPAALLLKMAAAQRDIPFNTVLEVLVMESAFELLREAGVRLPRPMGGAIGIVGGLIVGQAAVEAGLVSPVVVIVTALTGIAGFVLPGYQLGAALRLVKYGLLAASAAFGLFGFCLAGLGVMAHLCGLTSFGFSYVYPLAAGGLNGYEDMWDAYVRAPLSKLKRRPFFARGGRRGRAEGDE